MDKKLDLNNETNLFSRKVRDLVQHTLNKLSIDCSKLLGRNLGISSPKYEISTLKDFFSNNEGNFFMIVSEMADPYKGFIYTIIQFKDALKISCALLGYESEEVNEKIEEENIDDEYDEAMQEFCNQFSSMIGHVFKIKVKKPLQVKLHSCGMMNKSKSQDILIEELYCDYIHTDSILVIEGFKTGALHMFISIDTIDGCLGISPREKKRNILVIDDSSTDISIIRKYLSNTEFKVFSANDAAEAFDTLNKEEIHVILLDLFMPVHNGLDICREIKKVPHTKGIPVIFFSARPTQAAVIEALELGARDFLVKPVSKELLLSRMEKYKPREMMPKLH